ncbi:MAG TPA: T9SS type A sorting domain-containing protein [Bacteroidales bacterium]|nr:T9SS type A sorting domain-containing protein [Bacteroidales bacterium]
MATEKGLFYSEDEQTWTLAKDANGNVLNGVATDLCVGSNGIVIAAVDKKAYVSESGAVDGFVNQSTGAAGKLPLTNVGRIEFSISPANPDVIYALAATNIGTVLNAFRSKDKGNTWKVIGPAQSPEFNVFGFTSTAGTNYIGLYNNTIKAYPTDENVVVVGGADLWQGYQVVEEGFYAWSQTSSYAINPQIPIYVHQGINDIAFHPTQVGTAYLATDGGIFKATQNVGFQAKNKNYKTSQFFSVSFGPEGDVMGGSKDNGTLLITGDGNTPEEAEQLYGGDGTRCLISQVNHKAHIVSQPNGFFRRTVDYGANWRPVLGTDMSTVRGAYVAPILLWESFYNNNSVDSVSYVADADYPAGSKVTVRSINNHYPFTYQLPSALNEGEEIKVKDVISVHMFFGAIGGVWMTKNILNFNLDPAWGQIAEFTGTTQALAVSRDGDVLFAGTQDGQLYRISNLKAFINDSTFSGVVVDTLNAWTGRAITSLAYHSSAAGERLIVTLGNYGNSVYVYRSDNPLTASPTFQSAQGNLPPMPVYASLIEMNNRDRVMIGTEMGVYATSTINGNTTWVHEGNGMPDVPVFDLQQQTQAQAGIYIPGVVGLDTIWEVFPAMMNYGVIYAASHGRGLFRADNFVPLKEPNASGSLANPTLKVFPNPAREQASIGFSMDRAGEAFLQVYDLSGRILLSDYMGNAVKGENVFILDMGRLQTGTYFVRVHDGVLPVGSGKLIVQ